jgi:hypothetical protein
LNAAEAQRQRERQAEADRLAAQPPPVQYVHHYRNSGPCQVF